MIDLEPRVIHSIQSSTYRDLYNQENFFIAKDGGGAGNNWASGHRQGSEHEDHVMEMIDREVNPTSLCNTSHINRGPSDRLMVVTLLKDLYYVTLLLEVQVVAWARFFWNA